MNDPAVLVEWGLGTFLSEFEDQEMDEGRVKETNGLLKGPPCL